jgi:hypothetical protein
VTAATAQPPVTVLMAVFNGEQYIAAAVRSILAQSYEDFELLIVDDGSTDRSAAIVRGIKDPRIRVLPSERNVGLAASLNRGISEARGEFIARLDADDISSPHRLESQVTFMRANPDVALVGSWYTDITADGSRGAQHQLPTEHLDIRWHLCLYDPFVHSAVLWRRRTVAELIGGYDERLEYSMDYDLWRRIAARCRVANIPEYLVQLRAQDASMSATFGDRTREGLRMRAEYAGRLLGWPDDAPEANEQRFERLYGFLAATPRSDTSSELLRDALECVRFHDAFIRTEGLGSRAALEQHERVCHRVARRMLRAAGSSSIAGGSGACWNLLRGAARVAPETLLSRDAARACLRMIARAGMRAVRRDSPARPTLRASNSRT